MAILKKIKFGESTNNIAKTIVTAKSGGVMSVAAPDGVTNGIDEQDDYKYELDVNVDNATIVKSSGNLAVGTVPAAQVSVADSDNKFTATTVEAALAELKDDIDSTGNAAKRYKIVESASPASTSFKEYKVQVAVGSGAFADDTDSATIVVPKDNAFVTAQLGHVGATADSSTGTITDGSGEDALLIEYVNGSGVYTLVAVPIGAFLKEAEFKDGLVVNDSGEVSAKLGQGLEFGSETSENQSIKVKIDSTSESFLTVGAGGVKLAGVQDAINAKVAALDVTTDAAVAGQYVAAIEETDGVVAVKTRANVSEAVLNNYAKGSDATAVAATDTVNQAISKLENQVDAAKSAASAAHSVVAKDTNANHLTVTPTTDQSTGAVTYTIGETNIASASDLTAEVTRAQSAETAIDSAVGLAKAASGETRSFSPTTNYGGTGTSAATSVMDNMQKIDTALKNLSDTVGAIQYSVSGTELTFYGMTQHT